jgi:hypothetical protein
MSEGWHEFYFMIGSSAGALIGLLFVVITLTANFEPGRAEAGARVYVTPIVVHFASVLFISALSLVPELSVPVFGMLVLPPALGGLFYVGVIIRRFFGPLPTPPHWTDPIFYAAFPAVSYLALTSAAAAFLLGWAYAPAMLAAGVVALLFIGIRDAWDLALWLSTHPDGQA